MSFSNNCGVHFICLLSSLLPFFTFLSQESWFIIPTYVSNLSTKLAQTSFFTWILKFLNYEGGRDTTTGNNKPELWLVALSFLLLKPPVTLHLHSGLHELNHPISCNSSHLFQCLKSFFHIFFPHLILSFHGFSPW